MDVVDPDGKLGIEVHVKFDSKLEKYTVISVVFSGDLYKQPIDRGMSTGWYDYIKIVTDPSNPGEKPTTDFVLGKKRYTTTFLMQDAKWFAKWMVDDGVFEEYEYGGISWITPGQTSDSEESKKGKPSFTANIDDLLALINAKNALSAHEFERKDLLEVLEKLTGIIQETSDEKVGDILDVKDPNQSAIIKEFQALLTRIDGGSGGQPL